LQLETPAAKQARPSEHAKSVADARSKERGSGRKANKAARKTTKFDELVEPASLIVSSSLTLSLWLHCPFLCLVW